MNNGDFPLEGVTVIEHGRSKAVKLATRLLAGYGARVLIAEPSDGDHLDEAQRLFFDGSKELMSGDLVSAVRSADVLVTDRTLAARESSGIGAAVLEEAGTIVAAVTPYGEAGVGSQWPASELVLFAGGGQMAALGDEGREPLQAYGDQAGGQAALHVFGAVLAALIRKSRFGIVGSAIDISIQEVQASALEVFAGVAFNGDPHDIIASVFLPELKGSSWHAAWAMYECVDGLIGVHVNPPNWDQFCIALGRPDLKGRGRDRPLLLSDELKQAVADWLGPMTKAQAMEVATEFGIPLSYVADADDLLNSETVASTGLWREVTTAEGKTIKVPGPLNESMLRFDVAKA